MFSPRRSFPLRCCFSFAKAVRDATSVVAAAIIPSTRRRLIMTLFPLDVTLLPTTMIICCKRCDRVSFVILTEPVMNGPATDRVPWISQLSARAQITFNYLDRPRSCRGGSLQVDQRHQFNGTRSRVPKTV